MQQISHDTGDIKQGKTYEELQYQIGVNQALGQKINEVAKSIENLKKEKDEQEKKDAENVKFNEETKKKIR